jgi:hypothetical protein
MYNVCGIITVAVRKAFNKGRDSKLQEDILFMRIENEFFYKTHQPE